MNGLASLLRYQMGGPIGYMSGGPIGYATGGDIQNIYQTLFGRAPDEEGLAYYTQELTGVPLSVAFDRIAGGAQGADATAIEANRDVLFDKIVENIYREQLGYPADKAGKDFYVQQLASGKTATDLSNEIDKTLDGFNFDAERITSNYRKEFGRNPDQEGFQYYMSQEDALVGKADDKAVTDIIRGGVKGVDVQALAAKPDTGYTDLALKLEALGADPFAGRYATVDPYYFGGVPEDAVNVSRNALDQSIQFTNPVYEQPLVSWFDQDKGFQTTAGEQGDFQQFQAVSGNNVLQREDVENAINLALTSGALDSKTAANLRDRIDPASENKATNWNDLYETLKQPKASVVLNAMGVQVGEDVSADVALQESNARKELANIAATNTGGYPSAYYQSVVAQNLANETGKDVNEIYPFTSENLGLGRIDTKKTTADVFNNLGTEIGFVADEEIVRAPPIVTPGTPGGGTLQPGQGSSLAFAPLRRGLGQLRPAAFMPGLLEGQPGFGGAGFRPEQLRSAASDRTPQGIANFMNAYGVSPAELGAALERAPGEIQGMYNQFQPKGTFSTVAPQPYTLPEDFVLQTGAPQFPAFTSSLSTVAGNAGTGVDQPTYNELLENVQRLTAQIEPLINRGQVDAGGGEVGFSQDYSGLGFFGDVASAFGEPSEESSQAADGNKIGGLIRMAEGGELTAPPTPPKMSKLSAAEAGSTFNSSEFVDAQGRLVGGYNRPIYKDNVLVDYEFVPYESNVVFNPRLRERELMGVSPEEQEMALRAMIARQGLTGVNPMTGGLPGIMPREAVMRRRPDYNFAEGGLANVAQNLAERGRKGDSMLVHMAPEEVAGLRALARAQGTDMTINPRTGLPEAFSLKKLFKAASFILPFVPIPGLFGMSSLLTKSIFSGIAAGASAKGGFDFKQALGGGLKAYALGSLGEKISGAPTPGGAPTAPTTTVGEAAGGVNPMAGIENIEVPLSGQPALGPSTPIDTYKLQGGPAFIDQTASVPGSVPKGGAVPGRMANVITPEGQGFGQPFTKGTEIAMAGLGGFSIEEGAKETRRYELEAAAIRREEEERERRFEELARRTLGRVAVKSGGQINLAKGGMTYMEGGGTTDVTGEPRMVQGTGDGMSDSVPATIEGVQEARLANDEFVIPADVVADIGNGSSNAGAKKLYNMMDRIRKARHNTTEQPPEIQAERLMPA